MSRRSSGGGSGSRSSFSSSSSSSRSSFSSSSSYSSSNHSSGHSSYGHSHSHYHYGSYGPSVHVSGKTALILLVSTLMFFGLIYFIVSGSFIEPYNEMIQTKIEDYNRYVAMIERAETNPDYMTKAEVVLVDYDSEVGGYYFEYVIPYETKEYDRLDREYKTVTKKLTHSTFACYKYQDIANLINTEINVALDCRNTQITFSTDTMPVNYKNTRVQDDAEYKQIAQGRNKHIIGRVIAVILEIGGVVAIVFIAKHKKDETPSTASDSTTNYDSTTENSTTIKQKYSVCAYCGDTSLEGTKKCPTCGANLKISDK